MKILVYGAGVLGCNLARNLLRAGKDVTLLARGNWAAEIKQNGLRIKDKFSLRTSVSRIPVVTELAPDAMYDVIFVVLRYTQLDSVLDTLRANRTKNIVFVGNNVQARAQAAALPEKNVLFAFALSAGHREADRVVSIDLKKITIGQLTGATSNKQLIGRIFHGTKYKVVYEPNMEDYLLCHAAFVMPAAFACYKTDGDLKKLRGDTAYLNRLLDANIEGYRAIRDAGHTILPKEDADFEGEKYRKTCLRFFKLMCVTSLGKLCASDHAMNAIDEMNALNRDLKKFFDANRRSLPGMAGTGSGSREVSAMKYAGMPFGMWALFAGSFQKQLIAVLCYDADTAKAIQRFKTACGMSGDLSCSLTSFSSERSSAVQRWHQSAGWDVWRCLAGDCSHGASVILGGTGSAVWHLAQ